ncbi:50S ribosomal protein L9, partial [Candidatus Calescamantes bacterium]|nr:50S ribosomal protein L9 [Candidatus Calescamantes bacterium]
MKVIVAIAQDNLGNRGDIINIKDGYARNYLIPRGIVLPFSKGNIKKLDMEKTAYNKQVKKEILEAENVSAALSQVSLSFVEKTHNENMLYGSISEKDIHEKLTEQGFTLDKDQIVLEEHIKVIGDHTVNIKLKGGTEVSIRISVNPEDQPEPKEAKAEETVEPKAAVEPEAAVEQPETPSTPVEGLEEGSPE